MENVSIWGNKLRKLRKKADVTQGELVKQLSHVVSNLSDEECNDLAAIDLYEEATTYFGGILDTPTLSKLERGKRTLSRKRTVALAWGLGKLGVLETAEQANRFLEAAEHGHLTPTEQSRLFNGTIEIIEPITMIEPIVKPQKQGRFSALIAGGVGILIVGILLGLFYPRLFGAGLLDTPDFTDDFSGMAINRTLWDGQNAPSVSVEDGRLLFDTPINQTDEWYAEYVEPILSDSTLSRLTFDVVTDTPDMYQAGEIGVSMGCWNDNGWLNVYAGENPPHIFVEYASSDEIVDWVEDVHTVSLRPIERGETYTVDLNWSNSEVAIMIDDEPMGEPIPCNGTEYFNILVSVGVDEKVRGGIEKIAVWH